MNQKGASLVLDRNRVKRAFAMAAVVAGLCACEAPMTLAQVEPGGQRTTEHQLTQPERTEVINALLKWMESDYILPDVAKQMAQAVREHQAKHEYDSITDGEQFAKTLTHDRQGFSCNYFETREVLKSLRETGTRLGERNGMSPASL
jgi:hypothetical protein